MTRHFIASLIALVVALLPSIAGARDTAGSAAPQRVAYTWRLFLNTHPAPLFYDGAGIAVESHGDIVVADSGNHRIERFSPTGRLLASWGTDSGGPLFLTGPRAVAVDEDGSVYVADDGVVKLSSRGRFLARWRTGALSYPRGLTVDRNGNVYVLALHPVPHSDTFDRLTITERSKVGKVVPTYLNVYPTPAGDAVVAAALAATPDGNLLLSIHGRRFCHSCNGDYYSLRAISPTGRSLWEVPEAAGGGSMTVDAAGDIFLARPNGLLKLSATGAQVASIGSPGCGPAELGPHLRVAASLNTIVVADSQIAAIRPDNYPAPFRAGVLHVFSSDGTALSLLGTCPAPGAATVFGQINGLARSRQGSLYVADGIRNSIIRVTPQGIVAGAWSANHPSTVATDAAGNVYVPDPSHTLLTKQSPSGRLLARTQGLFLDAVAVSRDKRLYALTPFGEVLVLPPAGRGNKPLRRWWLQGYRGSGGGPSPEGICLDGQGNVWVADPRFNSIQKYSARGRLLRIWGRSGTGPGRFRGPSALTVDGRGHLFVADSGNSRVQEFDLNGKFLGSYGREGQAPGQFLSAQGIAADAAGNIYVGDRGNDRLQVLLRMPVPGS